MTGSSSHKEAVRAGVDLYRVITQVPAGEGCHLGERVGAGNIIGKILTPDYLASWLMSMAKASFSSICLSAASVRTYSPCSRVNWPDRISARESE